MKTLAINQKPKKGGTIAMPNPVMTSKNFNTSLKSPGIDQPNPKGFGKKGNSLFK